MDFPTAQPLICFLLPLMGKNRPFVKSALGTPAAMPQFCTWDMRQVLSPTLPCKAPFALQELKG